MLFRANGLGATVPLKEKVMAPLRVAKSMLGSMVGKGPAGVPEISVANLGGAMIGFFGRFTGKKKHGRDAHAT
jgi:hypothetical protein